MHLKYSFPPVIGERTHTLILGSMPGDKSIELQAYYGHPRNRFWPIMAALTNTTLPEHYPDRVDLLLNGGFGLWDVVEYAERKGSLDSDIKKEHPHPILDLLKAYPGVNTIAFNGKKAEALYRKYFEERQGISYHSLPSTSPANAMFNFDRLLEYWQVIGE